MVRGCAGGLIWLVALAALPSGHALASGVPIDGFLPLVAITLTDEFVNDLDFFPYPSTALGGSPVSSTSSQRYELALLDSGAAVSLITAAADARFNIGGSRPGNVDGFRGTETITIGGATGFLEASIGDPLGLYAAGVQGRTTSSGELAMNPTAFLGQNNTSLVTLPAESSLPNVLGLSFMSQYATRIRNSQPQVFEADGKTVRTPAMDFLPLGTGDAHGISRKAPMSLLGAGPSTPLYFPNIANLDLNRPWENPSQPTVVQGGHFLNVNTTNAGTTLSQQFFFDTGASVTVLSQLSALQLGIDVQLDAPDFTIQIIGSGGLSDAIPGYFIDQFTVLATGGNVTLSNVPVLVLDVTNPASPGNIVPGIVGTNVFAGRDIIIDPNPSLGGGGASPSVYISDPVTTEANFLTDAWNQGFAWSTGAPPNLTTIANVRRTAGVSPQATVLSDANAWEVNVAGASADEPMLLRVVTGATLTTFAGFTIESHGHVRLVNGHLDSQYVDIRGGGRLSGSGSIVTGSGPIPGQVENTGGAVAPGAGASGDGIGTLKIEGRFANGAAGTLEFEIGSSSIHPYDQIVVDGPVTLAGTLRLVSNGQSSPGLLSRYSIVTATGGISGEFDSLELPALTGNNVWHVAYTESSVDLNVTLRGDFDGDFDFDADDLAVWRDGFGTKYDGADFLHWQRRAGTRILLASPVPEPATATLAFGLVVAISSALRRGRRNSQRFGLVA